MTVLFACDQSVRGFAVATAPIAWREWSQVKTFRTDGGSVKRGDEFGALQRLRNVFNWVDGQVCDHNPDVIGFESYGFNKRPDVHVVELVGAIKLHMLKWHKTVETIQMSSARKLVAGPDVKIPRKGADAKALMRKTLIQNGAPATLSLDETDALVVLNAMLVQHAGRPLVTNH